MIVASFFIACALCQTEPAEETKPEVTKPEAAEAISPVAVRKLIRELDADQKAKRDDAERALLDLGPKLLDILPPAGETASAEVKERLGRIRAKLELERAEKLVEASRFTLTGGDMPLSEVLKELERQTGNKVVDYRENFQQEGGAKSISVDFDKAVFWEAFDTILDDAKLEIYPYADTEEARGALALVARADGGGARSNRATYAGAFRIAPTELIARRDLLAPDQNSLQVNLQFTWEPRLTPIVISLPMAGLSVLDDKGRRINAAEEGTQTIPVDRSASLMDFHVQLPLPQRDATKIATMNGLFFVLLGGAVEKFEFGELPSQEAVSKKAAAATVVLERFSKNEDLWEARVRISFDKNEESFTSHLDWVERNHVYVIDSHGEKVAAGSVFQTLDNENEKGFGYVFDLPDGPKGCKFVYETPGAVMNMPVEYELKDLELP